VRAQEAVTLMSEFQKPVTDFQFRAVPYALTLEAAYGRRRQWRTLLDFTLHVRTHDVDNLNRVFIVHDNWSEEETN
jgi:hypothetical protein